MDYQFESFTLSTESLRLDRDGEPLKLEPRLIELLAYLVENRRRVVTKDDLIEDVWQGRFVGDSAISRAVYEVRRTLGDDSKNPRFVRTVHGRGYQFIAAVTESEPPLPGPSAAQPEASREEGTEAQGPTEEAPGKPPRRRAFRALAALGSIGLVGAIGIWLWPTSSTPVQSTATSTSIAHERPTSSLALVPILPDDHTPDLQLVGISLTDLLYLRLRETPGLAVRPPNYDAQDSPSTESLADYARAAGVEYLLLGSLSPAPRGETILVAVELVDFQEGRARSTPLSPFSIPDPNDDEDLTEFLAVRDAIVSRVLDQLGPAFLPPTEDPTRPTDFAAYRLFLLAHQALMQGFCDGKAAIQLLEQSLEQDPTYVPAWDLLAVAHYNQVWACGASSANFERAREAVARSIDLAPRYINPLLVENMILIETGRVEEAYARLLRYRPTSDLRSEMLASELYTLRYAGFLERARSTLEMLLELDPLYYSTGASGESPTTLLYLGEYDRFLEVLPAFDSTYHRFYEGLGELLRGDPQKARSTLEPAFRINPAEIFARYAQTLLAQLDGDPKSAELILDQIVIQRSQLDAVDGEMSFKEAQLYALAGAHDKALTQVVRAIEQGFFCPRCYAEDPFLAAIRDQQEFQEVVRQAIERHRHFAERFGLEPDLP